MEMIATIAMISSLAVLALVVANKDIVKSNYIIFLCLAVALYMISNYVEIAGYSLKSPLVAIKIRVLGTAFIPTIWYFCVCELCGIKCKSKYAPLLLLIVPAYLVFLVFTWESNHLLLLDINYTGNNKHGNLNIVPGPLFIYRTVYQYGINVLGICTLIYYYQKGTPYFRRQILLFLLSALIPIFNVAIYMVNIGDYNVDITPYALLLSMFLFIGALYKFGVFNRSVVLKENAINDLGEGVLLCGANGIYMDANNSAKKIFPQLANVPLGTSIQELDYLPFSSLVTAHRNNGENQESEFTKEHDGVLKTFRVSISKVLVSNECIGYSIILSNITQMKQLLAALAAKSVTDPLTKVYNRGYLFELGKNYFENAKRNNESFSLLMIDVDFFKKVNDTFGHVYGDYVLITVASICSENLRKADLIARYGGEEFCALLPATDLEGAHLKAEALRLQISEHIFEYDGVKTNLTASFGVTTYLPEDTEFLDIIKRADEKLYEAKETGRNKVCS